MKKILPIHTYRIALAAILVLLVSIIPYGSIVSADTEVVSLRDQYSNTYYVDGKLDKRISIGSVNYEDANGDYQPINTTIVASDKANWDWEVETGHWKLLINNDGTVAVKKGNNWIGGRLHGMAYLDVVSKDYTILQTTNTVTPVVSGNEIRWSNILYGVDYVIRYTNDSLKEDIIKKQSARDLLNSAGNRPQDYGYAAQDTYLVSIFEMDWSQSLPMQLKNGDAVNPDEAEHEEAIYFVAPENDRYFNTNLVAFFPLDYAVSENPINPQDPEADWVYASAKIRKRLITKNGKHWLLMGVPVITLNQMPAGNIIFDPTETLRPDGAGDKTELSKWPNVANYLNVDDVTPDENSTKVYSQLAPDKTDLYNLPASSGAGTIDNITVYFRIRGNEGTISIHAAVKSGGTTDYGDSEDPVADYGLFTWGTYTMVWATNPDDAAAWDWSDIDDLQIGVMIGGSASSKDCTQVYVVVTSSAVEPNISNTPSTYNFGTMEASSTPTTGLDHFTITNNSGAAVSITIKATDWTGGNGWTHADNATPGEDTVGMKAGLEGGDYTIIVKKTASYNTLVSGLADSATQKWGLKVYVPTSFTDGVEKSTITTLTAVLD